MARDSQDMRKRSKRIDHKIKVASGNPALTRARGFFLLSFERATKSQTIHFKQ